MSIAGVTPTALAAAAAAAARAGVYGATGAQATTSSSPSAPGSKATSGPAKTMASQLATPDLFLKLLMAELQHENPTNPTTPSTILQQTAELSQLQSMTAMTTAVTQQRRYAASADANGLIGRHVTAVVTGHPLTGTVTQVSMTSGGTPYLRVDGTFVPLSSVVEVTSPTTAASSTGVASTAATGSNGTTGATTGGTTAPAA